MKYIAHRGLWKKESEQNSYNGIKKALDLGFGVELDVRDKNGELIVSHDPSFNVDVLLFEEILDLFSEYKSVLAVNVKSDGILENLKSVFENLDDKSYFLFDMSIPETISYLESGLPTYMRLSEYETYCALHEQSDGLWLDSFHSDWWVGVNEIFKSKKRICVVSPELHNRDKSDAWRYLRSLDTSVELYICTDFPQDAREFFG